MQMQEKVASLFKQIAQLPEDDQAELVEAIVAMRCVQLGIYSADGAGSDHIAD